MANFFFDSDTQQCFAIPDSGHRITAQIRFFQRSLSGVPQTFQVCDAVAVSCCDKVSAERARTLVDETLSSRLQPGTWLSGQFSFSASKDAPLTSCEESIRDVQCSITQAELEVPPSSRKRPTKRPREEDTTLTLDGITATHRQKGNVQQGGIIDTGNKLQDETTAASIVKRLIDGIKAVQKEVNVHGYKKSYDTSQTVSDELLTGTDSINQLGMNLWNHSDKVEQMAVDVVYLDRLLSSYCRLFLITRQEPVDYDPDPSKEETQKRHADAVSFLSLVVNGLYEFRHSLALVLYSAVCKKRFLFSGITKVGKVRRQHIAQLVVDKLRCEPITIAEDFTVLHPGVFLKHHKQSLQLPDICTALGLPNLKGLSLSGEEIGKYWRGVPIKLLVRQNANKFITRCDEGHGLNLITDCTNNNTRTGEEIQDHNTQQVESRQGDFGTNSAAEGQKPSTSHARSDDATGYGLPQDFRQCETTTLFQPRDNLACNGILLQEFTPPSSREDTDQNNAMADAMAVGTSIDSNPYYPTDLDEVLCNSNMIDYDTDFLGFQ
ncbi:unnamed protein product [Fusarium langsethiae]|nr:unnamed protein product [Fusarium langsethiae]